MKPVNIVSHDFLPASPVRLGLDPAAASENFWVPPLIQRGMLVQLDGRFYISIGSNPGLLYVTLPVVIK